VIPASEPKLGSGLALRLGFQQAVSLWPATVMVFAARAAQSVAEVAIGTAVFSFLGNSEALLGIGIGAGVTVWIFTQVCAVFFVGGSLRQGADRMRGLRVGSLLSQAATAAPRSFSYLFFGSLVQMLRIGWSVLAFTAAGLSYLRSLFAGIGGVASAGAMALALTIALPLALMALIWIEVALVRSVIRDQGYLVSLLEAVTAMRARLGTLVWLTLLTAGMAWVLTSSISAIFGLTGAGFSSSWQLTLAQGISVSVLSAFVVSLFELTRLQAFGGLTLDILAVAPVEALPVPMAEVVITALPVAEPPG
jgi:hypothetical protein